MPREVKIKIPKCKVLIIRTWSETVQVAGTSFLLCCFAMFHIFLFSMLHSPSDVCLCLFFTFQVTCLFVTSISFGKYSIKGIEPVILREILDY